MIAPNHIIIQPVGPITGIASGTPLFYSPV
jgi:hypothetical protein